MASFSREEINRKDVRVCVLYHPTQTEPFQAAVGMVKLQTAAPAHAAEELRDSGRDSEAEPALGAQTHPVLPEEGEEMDDEDLDEDDDVLILDADPEAPSPEATLRAKTGTE